jgi:hypothetical protein
MAALRLVVWCFFFGAVTYLLCIGPYWPALVVAVVGIVILALAEIDEHLTTRRGWYRRD